MEVPILFFMGVGIFPEKALVEASCSLNLRGQERRWGGLGRVGLTFARARSPHLSAPTLCEPSILVGENDPDCGSSWRCLVCREKSLVTGGAIVVHPVPHLETHYFCSGNNIVGSK